VRLAANHAIDRQAINDSLTLGYSRITASIIPQDFDFAWRAPLYAYDPRRAKQLLTEAGYPNGFEAGQISTDTAFAESLEPIATYFAAIGIRATVRSLERAAFFNQLRDKKLRPLAYAASGAFGNAATRLEAFVAAGGPYAYGSYPDIEGLIQEQALDRDRKRREATLHRIQQMMYDRAVFAPIWETATMNGYNQRVAEPAINLIVGYPWSAPYEEMRIRAR
jgi:peptide/nickel transport system substrate-binding protein